MNISSITLENFCRFADRRFDLACRFNLLIGDNGSGKTTILDGLSVGLGAFFLGITEPLPPRTIHRDEIRFQSYVQGDTYTREDQFPVVTCEGTLHDQSGQWSRELNSITGTTTRKNAGWIEEQASSLDAKVRNGAKATLPVLAYYGTGRLWVQKRAKAVEPLPPGSRLLGYLDCLDPASDEKRLLAWFKTQELQALQEQKRIGVLETVRQAILACIPDARHVFYHLSQDELLLRFADHEMPFSYLSDGYRNTLAIVADIAVRCATLNPALKERAIHDTPGVVLIDEIDLHLHPKWQRRVVEDFLRAFPRVQFIATTHSPFVIQSLLPGEGIQLINLDDAEKTDFADKSVEDIAEEVQGVELPSRSQRYQEMMACAEEYYRALAKADTTDPAELQHLKDRLDEQSRRFSNDPAYHAILKVEREARVGRNGGVDAPG